jgi:pimeloyl-ACP methyl ester carboxylesterase
MLTELVETDTSDGFTLHGAFYTAQQLPDTSFGLDAVLLLHGVGSNFYSSPLLKHLTAEFLRRGLTVLCVNTRGHDFVSLTRTDAGPQRQGAAYETVGHCHLDIAAWNDFLCGRGATRIGIVGHSLGAIKALFATAYHPHSATRRVVAISPPCLSYSAFLAGSRRVLFEKTIERARRHIAEGKPETLIRAKYPFPLLITAAGYLEKYGPEERYNILRFASRLSCPVLFTYGQLELDSGSTAFAGVPQQLSTLPGSPDALTIVTIPEADHVYSGVQNLVADRIVDWLKNT